MDTSPLSNVQPDSAAPSAVETKRPLPTILRIYALLATLIMATSWVTALLYPARPTQWDHSKGMFPRYDQWFTDLYQYDSTFSYFHTQAFFNSSERFAYPGPTAIPYYLFIQADSYRLAIFFLIALWLGSISALLFGRALFRNGIRKLDAVLFAFILLVTSWPLAFLVERANIEIVVIFFTLTGSLAYWKRHFRCAAILWGIAASMKLYPIVLLMLFLRRRQLGVLSIGLISFALCLLLSFWWVGPTMLAAIDGSIHGTQGFLSSYAFHARPVELNFDHSFLAAIKSPLSIIRLHVRQTTMDRIGHLYVPSAILSMLVLFYGRVRHLPDFNRFAILLVAMIAVPPVSYDYTLCHLYPVFALIVLMLVRTEEAGRTHPAFKPLLVCFLILLTSQTLIYYQAFHVNGLIKAIALFTALVFLLRYPIDDTLSHAVLSHTNEEIGTPASALV